MIHYLYGKILISTSLQVDSNHPEPVKTTDIVYHYWHSFQFKKVLKSREPNKGTECLVERKKEALMRRLLCRHDTAVGFGHFGTKFRWILLLHQRGICEISLKVNFARQFCYAKLTQNLICVCILRKSAKREFTIRKIAFSRFCEIFFEKTVRAGQF